MESDSDEFSDACEHLPQQQSPADGDTWSQSTDAYFESQAVFDDKDKPTECFTEAVGSDPPDSKPNPDDARLKLESLLSESELQERKSESLLLKESGNVSFRSSAFEDALKDYSKALTLCPLKFEKERAVMFSNRAACHSKLGDTDAALKDCDDALSLDPKYVRCLQRRANLREEKDRLSDALADYQLLLELDPGNEKARWACMVLPERVKKQQEEMKEKMLDQLKQLGNMVLKPFGLSTDNFKVQKNPDSEGYSINFVR